MKISTRLGVGLSLVAALTVAATAYLLGVVGQLRDLNDDLARTHVEAARIALRVVENVDGMAFFAGSYFMRGSTEDLGRWAEYEDAVEQDLERLRDLELDGGEAEQREEVLAAWESYHETVGTFAGSGAPIPGFAVIPPGSALEFDRGSVEAVREVEAVLDEVGLATDDLLARNEEAAGAAARASREAAERARNISLLTGAGVVAAAVLVFALVFASVSGPLRRLTHGTRELARGRLEHRLEVRGRHELAELAEDFNRMAARLHELDDLKRDFVSHVSHELKGPLASIHETIEILLEEIPGPLTDKQRELLTLARDSSNRLSGMIRNLLEASRLEAGMEDYALGRHDLAEVASSVRRELAGMASDRGQTIEVEVTLSDTDFVGDGDRVREVVANLAGNAVKFSPRGGRIELRIAPPTEAPSPPGRSEPVGASAAPTPLPEVEGAAPQPAAEQGTVRPAMGLQAEESPEPELLLLEVLDEGPGIPDRDKDRIFDKFYRARRDGDDKRGTADAGGVGLGLTICRRIIEAHGGDLWVEDAPSGGACFRVLLPRRPRTPADGCGWRSRARSAGPSEDPDGKGGERLLAPSHSRRGGGRERAALEPRR